MTQRGNFALRPRTLLGALDAGFRPLEKMGGLLAVIPGEVEPVDFGSFHFL